MTVPVKKIIALAMTVAMVGLVGYGMVVGKEVPTHFMSITTMIVGYYFGRSHGEEDTKIKGG